MNWFTIHVTLQGFLSSTGLGKRHERILGEYPVAVGNTATGYLQVVHSTAFFPDDNKKKKKLSSG